MKLFLKRNRIYIIVGVICLFVLYLPTILNRVNFFEIIYLAFTKEGYVTSFFVNSDVEWVRMIEDHTIWNIINVLISDLIRRGVQLDVCLIFSKQLLQIVLPFFAIIGGVKFYNHYHSIMHFEYGFEKRTRYRKTIFSYMNINALKVAMSIYLPYVIFILIILLFFKLGKNGAEFRSLFSDIIGNGLYQNHTAIYFLLEGFVTMVMMPYAYTMLAQSVVLLGSNLKEVIATPIAYYYGFATLGYSLFRIFPRLSIYINPSVIMAAGSYDLSTILLIAINMIPLIIALLISYWRTRRVEI